MKALPRHATPPARYGRYQLLHPSTAMTFYPDIRSVPASIPRPGYVPKNFFEAGWGDHHPSEGEGEGLVTEMDKGGVESVRKVGNMAGRVLKEIEKFIKVCYRLIMRQC